MRRVALSLAVSVAGIGAAVYTIHSQLTARDEGTRAALERAALLRFSPRDIAAIELDNDHGRFVLARGDADAWILTAPVRTAANSEVVSGLLDQVARARREAVVPGPTGGEPDLSLFGLGPPRFSLLLRHRDGTVQTLLAGKRNSFDGRLYTIVSGEAEVAMTAGGLFYQLARNLLQLRDKRLVVFDPGTVEEIRVDTRSASYVLARHSGAERFALTAPRVARADPERVAKLLSALGDLRARRFVSEASTREELRDWGLARPTVTATVRLQPIAGVHTAEETPRTLVIHMVRRDPGGHTAPSIYATTDLGGPIIELASSWPLQQLMVEVDDLIDRHLLTFERDAVAEVELHSAAGVVLLEGATRTSTGHPAWTVRRPAGRPAPAKEAQVFALLYALWRLSARSAVGGSVTAERLAALGLGDDAPTIDLKDRAGKSLGALRFGALHGDQRWVTVLGSGKARLATKRAVDALAFEFDAYADDRATDR